MQIKKYLIESFEYNDYANKLALSKMGELSAPDECVKLFSHLINSMNKWLGRIEKWGERVAFPASVDISVAMVSGNMPEDMQEPNDQGSLPASYKDMDWWLPVYALDELESKWNQCLRRWMTFLEAQSEEELYEEVEFYGFDGGNWAAVLKDIALQLNYHSIHHRAQIQYLIRQQGIEPKFVDYIGTRYRKLG